MNIEKDFQINMVKIGRDFTEKNYVRKIIFELIFKDIFCLFTALKHDKNKK